MWGTCSRPQALYCRTRMESFRQVGAGGYVRSLFMLSPLLLCGPHCVSATNLRCARELKETMCARLRQALTHESGAKSLHECVTTSPTASPSPPRSRGRSVNVPSIDPATAKDGRAACPFRRRSSSCGEAEDFLTTNTSASTHRDRIATDGEAACTDGRLTEEPPRSELDSRCKYVELEPSTARGRI